MINRTEREGYVHTQVRNLRDFLKSKGLFQTLIQPKPYTSQPISANCVWMHKTTYLVSECVTNLACNLSKPEVT